MIIVKDSAGKTILTGRQVGPLKAIPFIADTMYILNIKSRSMSFKAAVKAWSDKGYSVDIN